MSRREVQRAVFPTIGLVLLFLFVWGCQPRAFTNLRVVSVTKVPASALPRPEPDPLPQLGNEVLKLTLSGSAQWVRDVKRLEMNSYPIIVRCDQRNAEVYGDGPYVGRARVTSYDDRLPAYALSVRSVRYDVYLPLAGRYRSEADFNAPMPPYDFRRERMQLCLSIAGGSMAGAYGRSNEVRLEIGHR